MKLKKYYKNYYKKYFMTYTQPSSQDSYKRVWKNHLKDYWGDWKLEDIRVKDINKWLLKNFEGIPGAARSSCAMLKRILKAAMADEVYSEKVAPPNFCGIKLPKKPIKEPPRCLTLKEMKILLEEIKGFIYEPVVTCAVWLGLRRSESCGLQWRDIDLETGEVRIRRGIQVIKGKVIETKVKTHRSMRVIVLPKEAVLRLNEIKKNLQPKEADWLIGNDLNPNTYAVKLKQFAKKKNIFCPAPKFFRHSFAKNMHELGMSDFDIQDMLGHESFSTSANNYLYSDATSRKSNIQTLANGLMAA